MFGQIIKDNRDARNLLSSFLLFWLWIRRCGTTIRARNNLVRPS
jgi:hypothetical protein